MIDQHYYAIASKATILKPSELNIPADKFKAQFGEEWSTVLKRAKGGVRCVMNAADCCEHFKLSADQLNAKWAKCKKDGKMVKFGGGFYCGFIDDLNCYTFNGFFMTMRSNFTAPGRSIYYYAVEWDASKLKWEDFRGKVLGPTDPAEAPKDSLRGKIYADWKNLGLKAEPNVGDNGVHASASPFEALAELNNWCGMALKDVGFGRDMVAAGISEATIKDWSVDPQVKIEGDKKGSLFDAVEDMDSAECLAKLKQLNTLNKSCCCLPDCSECFAKMKQLAANGTLGQLVGVACLVAAVKAL